MASGTEFRRKFLQLVRNYEIRNQLKLRELGLSVGQPKVLEALICKGDAEISQRELAVACNVDPTTLSRLLDNMEVHGLVVRMPSSESRRTFSIHITEKGLTCGKQTAEYYQQMDEAAFVNFTETEKQQMLQYLDRMNHNLGDLDLNGNLTK